MNDVVTKVQGKVKWFNQAKGYGFIVQDEKGPDIFVHFSAISGTGYKLLHEGDRVEFKIVKKEKGMQAEDVVVIDNKD